MIEGVFVPATEELMGTHKLAFNRSLKLWKLNIAHTVHCYQFQQVPKTIENVHCTHCPDLSDASLLYAKKVLYRWKANTILDVKHMEYPSRGLTSIWFILSK